MIYEKFSANKIDDEALAISFFRIVIINLFSSVSLCNKSLIKNERQLSVLVLSLFVLKTQSAVQCLNSIFIP